MQSVQRKICEVEVYLQTKTSPKRIWVTWENQMRNHTLSRALGAKLFQFDIKLNRSIRYPIALLKTLLTFIKERPNLIFVQNPSLVLSFFAVNYGRFVKIPIVVDAHNAGIHPFNGTKWWANSLANYLFRFATFTIVTNDTLAEYVSERGGNPFVLEDPIPEFEYQASKRDLKGKFKFLFICSWASDEPYTEVIKAANLLDKHIYIYITGKTKGRERMLKGILPENVILTGYLSEKDFIQMLFSVDVVIDLTTRKDCLVCGAYEAVAMGKPLITSDTEVLRSYFYKGALYTNNECTDLNNQINMAILKKNSLTQGIKDLKSELTIKWNARKNTFEELLLGITK